MTRGPVDVRTERAERPGRAVAPWVRTRLRTAPGAAVAFGLLVLITAFLAAALPRAVDSYETGGLRREIADAPPSATALQLTTPQPGLEIPLPAREEEMRPAALSAVHRKVLASLPGPLRADAAESAYGVRTSEALSGQDSWLPRPDGVSPGFTLATQSDLAAHAAVREGRLPAADGRITAETKELEAAVTSETARTLRLRVGSAIRLSDSTGSTDLAVRITGIVDPRGPQGSYWSVEPVLRTPGLAALPSNPPLYRWEAGLLLAPDAGPALLGTQSMPERYWRVAPATGGLTAQDTPGLLQRIASSKADPNC